MVQPYWRPLLYTLIGGPYCAPLLCISSYWSTLLCTLFGGPYCAPLLEALIVHILLLEHLIGASGARGAGMVTETRLEEGTSVGR